MDRCQVFVPRFPGRVRVAHKSARYPCPTEEKEKEKEGFRGAGRFHVHKLPVPNGKKNANDSR